MADLIFSFQEMLAEIQAMSLIGSDFLSTETLPNLVNVLESIRVARRPTVSSWSVTPERPI